MNNSQEVANLIKDVSKNKGIKVGDMLEACGLSKNALSSMQSGYLPRIENLVKIADYLGVSVDYLLGRSEPLRPAPESEWMRVLNQMSDEDLRSMKSYAQYLISKQSTENKDLEKDLSERVKENGIQEE